MHPLGHTSSSPPSSSSFSSHAIWIEARTVLQIEQIVLLTVCLLILKLFIRLILTHLRSSRLLREWVLPSHHVFLILIDKATRRIVQCTIKLLAKHIVALLPWLEVRRVNIIIILFLGLLTVLPLLVALKQGLWVGLL